MAERISSTIKKRVDLIQPGSSTYNYYMNTPLSELTDKTEKLIKKELEKRELKLLNENNKLSAGSMSLLNEDMAANANLNSDEETEEKEKKNGSWKDVAIGTTIGTAAGVGGVALAYPKVIDHCKEWLSDVGDWLKDWWTGDEKDKTEDNSTSSTIDNKSSDTSSTDSSSSEPSNKPTDIDASFFQRYVTSPITDTFNSVVTFFNDQISDLFGTDKDTTKGYVQWGVGIFAAALVVLVVYAVWKLIKKYIRDDGTQKDKDEDLSESIEPNVALAVITEAQTEYASGANGLTGLRAIMKRYADGLIDKLLDDPKFIRYMGKEKPELLEDLQDYQKANSALSESLTDIQYFKQYETLYEAEDAELNDSSDESQGMLSKIATTFGDTTNKVVGKIKDIYNRIANHPNALIRWIPPIVVSALTILAIGHYWNNRIIDTEDSNKKWMDPKGTVLDNLPNESILKSSLNSSNKIHTNKLTDDDAKIFAKSINAGIGAMPNNYNIDKEIQSGSNLGSTDNWNHNYFNYKSESELESNNYSLFFRSLGAMDFITEAMTKYSRNSVLDNLSGKGEKLADNIIERAKYVATDLVNDSDFVSFSKEKNPEMLKVVKKYANSTKGAKKVDKLATNKNKK